MYISLCSPNYREHEMSHYTRSSKACGLLVTLLYPKNVCIFNGFTAGVDFPNRNREVEFIVLILRFDL